jgi:hypothetical protein
MTRRLALVLIGDTKGHIDLSGQGTKPALVSDLTATAPGYVGESTQLKPITPLPERRPGDAFRQLAHIYVHSSNTFVQQ